MSDEGQNQLRAGSRRFGTASVRIEMGDRSRGAEALLRESFSILRSAMNHLEDTPLFETAHRRLDQAGEMARRHFRRGCALPFEDGSYHQRCPVALAHNRVGLSIEYIVRASECSICGLDSDECIHVTGRMYGPERCLRVITAAELTGTAMVGRPAFADAAIHSVSISTAEVRSRLGEGFQPGVTTVYCDRCLSACDGVVRPFESSGH